MKKTILTTIGAFTILLSFAQIPSDTLIVKMDTTTFKNIIGIIQTQLDSKKASEYVLNALSHYELIMDKPKELKVNKK